ncbi:MAG: AtpZ/AtpI family protein [bacterium]|nr:AtpZ/AtpI family protein [bacterium]
MITEGNKQDRKNLVKRELVSIAFQLGFIIAIPVVVFAYFGKWLDARAGTDPLLTLIGILTAIIFTSVWIYRKFKVYFKNNS